MPSAFTLQPSNMSVPPALPSKYPRDDRRDRMQLRCLDFQLMSALLLRTDIAQGKGEVRKVPITDSGTAANGITNHLVSTQQEGLGNG
jgi:hypothetical protein